MVSRRKILSKSRDDLTFDPTYFKKEEEDVWFQKDKLFKDHLQEVLDKWNQIDDEIWAKVIVFERNRRVAKAYARAPVLTINGSDDGFDGMKIGLCGFDNPMRDKRTDEYKRHIAQGIKIKMDEAGNILVRRYCKSNIYVKSTSPNVAEETAIGAEITKLPGMAIETEKIVKLFDMKKFQSNVHRELSRGYPDRRKLETQCLSMLAFVKSENEVLDCPIWVLIINVVAMDMLKSKLPIAPSIVGAPTQRQFDIKNRPRIPIPDEDPYSTAENFASATSSNSGLKRGEKPPKLPPRDKIYSSEIQKPVIYETKEESKLKLFSRSRSKKDQEKDNNNRKYEDPYYCGLRARVPNFVKSNKKNSKDLKRGLSHPASMSNLLPQVRRAPNMQESIRMPPERNAALWHARSYESGIDLQESPYSHLYGHTAIPRGYVPAPRSMYIGEWD
ncbi:uncharacterized protein LOC134831549 isoform X2 [Culicoides brevitarsis]|uniref:uncharacterized protein LOC134831549 isoform X2 n=1 Tax=Culicoides brevitarsis TaxID=469753 RepID=UPI00307C910E